MIIRSKNHCIQMEIFSPKPSVSFTPIDSITKWPKTHLNRRYTVLQFNMLRIRTRNVSGSIYIRDKC